MKDLIMSVQESLQLGLVFQSDIDTKKAMAIKKRLVKLTRSLEYLYGLVIQSNIFENKITILHEISSIDEWVELAHQVLRLVPFFNEDYESINKTLTAVTDVQIEQVHRAYKDMKKATSALITSFEDYPHDQASPIYENILLHLNESVIGLSVNLKYSEFNV